jgi:predicted P-loop ATPase/GTPase
MIYQLVIKKEKIFNENFEIFSEQIGVMDDGIYTLMKDEKWNVNFNVEWLNKLKNLVTISREELSTIPPEKRIEALQSLLQSKQKSLGELKETLNEKSSSLIDDINKQIQYYREELVRINSELEKEKNPAKRFFKDWKKGKIENKKAEFD